ncbi:hypothetical protein [Rhizobium laguerreae]|uniref:hypothetical protein n=1 Tax=Rhizobium laguerreae TaxID=1076926 RepID=UPI001038F1C1|nr:hypothetical protein [Rhizobium laguerreae]TBY12097.1 hypothetical protein E0J21_06530 [Rhizobium laguerreae]
MEALIIRHEDSKCRGVPEEGFADLDCIRGALASVSVVGQHFSEKALADLENALAEVTPKALALREKYVRHSFNTARGKEYALHGFARRLDGLAHCINTVFKAVPPDGNGIPERESLIKAAVNIQAFLINVAGCCDNAAWVWVFEKGVTHSDGSALAQKMVGLTSEHKVVWKSLSKDFRIYLSSRRSWLKHVKAFRDSLAHRIPLYVPPHTVRPEDTEEYQRLEHESFAALLGGDLNQYEALDSKQKELMNFSPVMVHSIAEKSPMALFHAQMLADFATVEELGEQLLNELLRRSRVDSPRKPKLP